MLPEELKNARLSLGVSAGRMAELIGIPRVTYKKYESGIFIMPSGIAKKVNELLETKKQEEAEKPKRGRRAKAAKEISVSSVQTATQTEKPEESTDITPAKKQPIHLGKKRLRYLIEIYEIEK